MSTSIRFVMVSLPSMSEYSPIAIRCKRSTGCVAAASCRTSKEVNRPGRTLVYQGRARPGERG
jgi:hypothetical protein